MIQWNRVTWYSRLAAIVVVFGLIPVLSFRIGARYQEVRAIHEEVAVLSW